MSSEENKDNINEENEENKENKENEENKENKENEENEENEEDEEFEIEFLSENYGQYDLTFKLIILGDQAVGKSCLTLKAVRDNFVEYYQATVGFEFLTFYLKVDKKVIKLQIWDTCGQEIYKSLITNFYRNSSLAILVYAINDRISFEHAEDWLNELKAQANPEVRIFFIGNKCDLEELRKVQREEGEKFKEEKKLDLFMETSAKTGLNAKDVLVKAAKLLYTDYLRYKEIEEKKLNNETDEDNIEKNKKLGKKNNNKKGKRICC